MRLKTDSKGLVDRYTYQARLLPVVLAVLPILVWGCSAAAVWSPGLTKLPGASAVAAALIFLGAQVGRDGGKRLEASLWTGWGGAPTTLLLRWRDNSNASLITHRHESVQSVVAPAIALPTAAEETADPTHADHVYETAITILRSRTRDRKRFPLVFAENINYGFRRNLLGLKALGIWSCGVTLLAVAASAGLIVPAGHAELTVPLVVLPTLTATIGLVLWIKSTGPEWVRVAAEAYAHRLLEAADELASGRPTARKHPKK